MRFQVGFFVLLLNSCGMATGEPPQYLRRQQELQHSSYGVQAKGSLVGIEPMDNTTTRIIGGSPAKHPYPFFGLWTVGCGASLISDDMMLTAAHCVDGWDPIAGRRVYLGSLKLKQGIVRNVVDMIPHPSYVNAEYNYDFMLIKLNASALVEEQYDETTKQWTSTPTNLSVVTLNRDNSNPHPNDELLVMGFGLTDVDDNGMQNELHEVSLLADSLSCRNAYPGMYMFETMLCAGHPEGGKDSCSGKYQSQQPTLGTTLGKWWI